jgi:uncharacterized membrane protein HdeD (DUF308 family)
MRGGVQRLLGALLGFAMVLFGALLYFGPPAELAAPVRERAAGLGITLIVVGAIAILGSLGRRGAERLWYRKPERWRMLHGRPTSWRQWWRS